MDIEGAIRIGINVGGGPARVRSTIVFIPGNGAVVCRGRDNVEVAIHVQVGHMDIPGIVRIGINIGRGPARVRRPIVLVPGDGVVKGRGRDDVEVAIPVHVGHMDIEGAIRAGGDIGGGPARVRRPVVLVPGDGVVKGRGRDDVKIAIPVHVGNKDIEGAIRIGINVCRGKRERIIGACVINRDGLGRCGGQCRSKSRIGGTFI